MSFLEIFNTREQAYILFGLAFAVFAWFNQGIRKDFQPVLAALFIRHFLFIYALTIVYTTVCVLLLSKIGMWDYELLKDTIIWMIFAALPSMFKAGSAPDVKRYFKSTLLELVQVTIVLEFIMGLYTFELWLELIISASVIFLQGLIAFSHRPEQAQVRKIFKVMNLLICIGMAFFVALHLFSHYIKYWTFSYFEQFALSIELTFMLIPFLYLLVLYMRFEELFTTINSMINLPSLLRYTKFMLMINFSNNIAGIKRWEQQFLVNRPGNKQDVMKSIKDIKDTQRDEAAPPEVNADEGWSPYMSKDFMKEHSLAAGQYIYYYNDLWSAGSTPFHLSDDHFANDLVYEVSGNKTVVTQLELILKVFDESKKGNVHEVFIFYFSLLFDKVFPSKPVPSELISAILNAREFKMDYKDFRLACHLDRYNNHYNTYNLKVAIRHPKYTDEFQNDDVGTVDEQ